MKSRILLLAGATAISMGAFATGAQAESIYTDRAPSAATSTTVTTTGGDKVVKEVYRAVGTRKVGRVGYHPYPLKRTHVESNTVIERPTHTTTSVNYGAGMAPVATTQSGVSTTTTTTSSAPINYSQGGGVYYTEYDAAGRQYEDPALNIRVHETGSFNN